MDFVVEMLESVFHKQPAEAFRIMMAVHTQGKGLCGVYPFEVAETKVDDGRGARARERLSAARGNGTGVNPSIPKVQAINDVQSISRNRADRGVPRGDVAAAYAPDARAPALRAGARPGRRADSRRVRRRSAAAAPRSRQVPRRSRVEQFSRGQQKEPEQTLAFRRVLQTAVLHVQSARPAGSAVGRRARGDAPADQVVRRAAARGAGRHAARRARVHLARHQQGAARRRRRPTPTASPATPRRAAANAAPATARDPLGAYALNLTDRARAGELDPLIGRADELQRTIEILCRRRKNNPVFVGDAGVGKTALAEGPRRAAARRRRARSCSKGAEVFSLDTGALLAGTRFRGDFEERFKAVINALAKRPMPILFIDEIHSTVGAGATTGGTMDLATLIKPILTAGELRVVGSTTHEEFKHIEKDRALARRLQKIAIDEPSIEETVKILQGLRSRYEAHHRVTLHGRRRSRRRRSWRRATCATTSCPTAPSTCSTRRARRCG